MTDIREQEMQQEINELKSENAYLKQQVSLLKHHLFGRKTEKQSAVVPPEQMSLFNEAEGTDAGCQRTHPQEESRPS